MSRNAPRRSAAVGLFTLLFASQAHAASDADILKPTTNFTKPERYELSPAGAATSRKLVNPNAFSQSSANMAFEK